MVNLTRKSDGLAIASLMYCNLPGNGADEFGE
jgi:hypothetical protein